ncbi:MAG: IgA Peptidase M64 [Acidobacteriota bacterium]|nr:IgA Peptidase M64 [Acidobacteriota bacterium]
MKKSILAFVLLLQVTASVAVEPPRTMRVDYYHTGDVSHEIFSLDRVVLEPLMWPGNPDRSVDDTNLGKYLFEVRDRATNRILYSRGFASIYGEWETTDEAKTMHRTFSESLRFPAPERAAQIILKKRDARNAFREIWTFTLDPKDIFVSSAKPAQAGSVIEIERNGDSAKKLDFLILGDGYTAAESDKFEKDARRLASIFFDTEPFKSRRKDFNVWALCPTSPESGISRPAEGIHRRSALSATYSAFGSERYILTFENKTFRDIASWAPYEVVEILVNDKTYGGGGIFNLYGTVAADSLWAPYIFIHEFGHHLAGLADEYYTSDVAYNPPAEKIEPWEPNATALLPGSNLKWGHLVDPGTPIPTPWNKETFEKFSLDMQARRRELRKEGRPESEINALFTEERVREERMFREEKYAGKVGAFEGANYEAKGYYRPEANCIMFTRTNYFCRVCQTAIEKVLDLYTRP